MSFLKKFSRTEFFREFSSEEQYQYFYLKEKKYLHHVDTLYYSVFLQGDSKEDYPAGIDSMFKDLNTAKELLKDLNDELWIDANKEILLKRKRFKIYDYCIAKNNYFDIFFCSSLPNNNTPRIVIQLRSIGLWNLGDSELVLESYHYLLQFLSKYGLKVLKTQENRIDFCYHTNAVQNPQRFYNDSVLSNNCRTNLSIFQKVGRKNGKSLDYDYLSFGRRTSNNIFFRSYNKVREVIEENYKEFFIKLWFDEGLITYYDFFVYSYAYKFSSYHKIYEGMMEFYLQYGKDIFFKNKLLKLKSRKFTVEDVKTLVLSYMPLPTAVINIEFQTMRKFYFKCLELDFLPVSTECDFPLLRIFQILDCRKVFLDYLTSTTISFVKSIDKYGQPVYMDFWKRLRNLKLDKMVNYDFKRDYSRNINRDILISRIKNSLATLSLYDGNWDTDINQDMSSLICVLNDNDYVQNDDGTIKYLDDDYTVKKEKIMKALKSTLRNSRPSK